jgi:hypothetical protein
MGLHNTAHYLKSKGRGRDTELVHMSKREIKGLQDLALAHGGSLSINPETGLVEAGFLEQILPVVAAAGLTYLTAGAAAPVLSAAMGSTMAGGIAAGAGAGALISGGTAAIQGKDVGNAALMGGLGGAISGGLGAYDGAATADLFTKGATDATSTAAQEAAKGVTAQSVAGGVDAAGNAVTMANPAGTGFISGETGLPISNALYPNATQAGTNVAQMAPGAARNAALDQLAGQNQVFAEGASQVAGQNLAVAPQPSYYAGLKPDSYVQKAAIQALPVATLLEDDEQNIGGMPEEQKKYGYDLSPNFQRYAAPKPNPYYSARYPTYAAEGGIMQLAEGGMTSEGSYGYPMNKNPDTTPNLEVAYGMAAGGIPKDFRRDMPSFSSKIVSDSDPSTRGLSALDATLHRNKKLMARSGIKMADMPKTGIKALGGDFSDAAAGGGIAHLGSYSDGGRLLKGPGDGMSDNIPATIGRKQPARLADGEFVVPADVVSHLGNGSTDAGAKKLYAMMDKIRKARTGKKKQAPAVKAHKYMPA